MEGYARPRLVVEPQFLDFVPRWSCACCGIVAVTERVTVRLPDGFDADRHAAALARFIADRHGAGFEVVSIDPVSRTAYATRQVAITKVTGNRATGQPHTVSRCDWPVVPGRQTAGSWRRNSRSRTLGSR